MTYNARMTLLARLGFGARGIVYLLVGWFALDAAKNGGRPSDNQGAMASMLEAPFGKALLGLCAIGFVGYAIWRITEAALDPERRGAAAKGRFERLGFALSGLAHIGLAFLSARLALQDISASPSSPGDESAQSWSGWLLQQPGGTALLTAVGILLIIVAAAQLVKAYKARFDDLGGGTPAPMYVRWMGRAGYAARGIIFAMIGWFVITAARQNDSAEAGGMGRALRELQAQEQGAILLGIVAIGLILFGVFSLVEAKYRRISVAKPRVG